MTDENVDISEDEVGYEGEDEDEGVVVEGQVLMLLLV